MDVKQKGFDELNDAMKRLPSRMQKNVLRSALGAAGTVVVKEARNNLPGGMTTLRKALRTKHRRGDRTLAQLNVGWTKGRGAKHDAWYGHFFERGADAHDISPKNRKMLRFIGNEGEQVFTVKTVTHPGIGAIHFLERAYTSTKQKQLDAFSEKAWDGIVKQLAAMPRAAAWKAVRRR